MHKSHKNGQNVQLTRRYIYAQYVKLKEKSSLNYPLQMLEYQSVNRGKKQIIQRVFPLKRKNKAPRKQTSFVTISTWNTTERKQKIENFYHLYTNKRYIP
jgi:hypothetical protein